MDVRNIKYIDVKRYPVDVFSIRICMYVRYITSILKETI